MTCYNEDAKFASCGSKTAMKIISLSQPKAICTLSVITLPTKLFAIIISTLTIFLL